MHIEYEATDLFGGEPNYAWVKRGEIKTDKDTSDLALVRRVKKVPAWQNLRCRTERSSDGITLYLVGFNMICFTIFQEDDNATQKPNQNNP